MTDSPFNPIPPEISDIVAIYITLTTRAEIDAFRKTLTPNQLTALDKWIKGLPKAKQRKPPKTKTELLKDFLSWTDPLVGMTREEQIQDYLDTHDIAPQDVETLRQQIKKNDAAKEEAEKKKNKNETTPPEKPVTPELVIKPTPYPKWWKEESIAKIAFTSPGAQIVVSAKGDLELYISTIVLTADGETNIVFTFGSAGESGPMDFGGDGEPKGMVIAMGNSPATCGQASFVITASSTDPASINGFVAYYLWKKEAQQKP